jgi:hypothetical protein
MAKGVKTGGRRPGSPNKATRDVRAAIAIIAEKNIDSVQAWLGEIEDPGKRLDLFIRLLEYHVPKLARTEMTGKDGGALVYVFEKVDDQ